MKKTILRRYAKLLVRRGLNVQKGQEVTVNAQLDQPEFVTMVVEEAYRAGAKQVRVDWSYQKLTAFHVKYQSVETLGSVSEEEQAKWAHRAEALPCRLLLLSEDPDGLANMDQEKLSRAQALKYPIIKPYRDKVENREQWCIAAVPGVQWAKKLFPGLRTTQAVEALWEAILDAARALGDDPIAAWDAHNQEIHEKCAILNGLSLKKLHYYGDNGTDLWVGLIPEGMFSGASEKTLSGRSFNPNIPSEECFTTPMRGQAEGIVYATKPLSYQGALIENFSIRFSGGKATEWHAEKNEALLGQLISMDEGSAYLGECALVPEDSPIAKQGLLYLNTLFDENAACHLALGMGFADTIRDYANKTLEECRSLGVNDSMVHEDFMIGYPGLQIDGITQGGKTVPIFRNGNWAL